MMYASKEVHLADIDNAAFQAALESIQNKPAYDQAIALAPEIVETESNPSKFLRFADSNPEAAAQRLVSYWQRRQDIFGEQSFFLPLMNLSGKGALTQRDVQIIQSGCILELPADDCGRIVLYLDRSKRPENEKTSARVVFYFMQVASDNRASQGDGVVILFNLSNPFSACFDSSKISLASNLLKSAMPLKIFRMHLVCQSPSGTKKQHDLQQAFVTARQKLEPCFGEYMTVHTVRSKDDCALKLRHHGLAREKLPVTFGGTWKNQYGRVTLHYDAQLQINPNLSCLIRNSLWAYNAKVRAEPARTRKETMRHNPLHARNKSCAREMHEKRAGTLPSSAAKPSRLHDTTSPEDPDELARKKRKRREQDVLYSRRKREKKRIEIEVIKQQRVDMEKQKQGLLSENRRLETLLQLALKEVTALKNPQVCS